MNVAPPNVGDRILPARRHTQNFIAAYLDYTQHHEASRKFHRWTAISILAAALGRRVYLDYGIFTVYPNLYILIVGPAGIVKKSTTTAIGVNMLKEVPGIHTMATQITPAAMVEAMRSAEQRYMVPGQDMPKVQSAVLIYASEFKNFIAEIYGSLVESLTDLFDCNNRFERQTKKDGLTTVHYPCINLLGCSTSTWLKESIPVSQLEGGFASRILFVVDNSMPERFVAIPKIDPLGEAKRSKLIDDLCHIAQYAGAMRMTPEAEKLYTEWYEAHMTRLMVEGTSNKFAGYAGRRGTMATKLSMVLSVNEGNSLIVEERHVAEAISLVEDLAQGMFDAFQAAGANDMAGKSAITYETIRRRNGITQQALLQTHWQDIGLEDMTQVCNYLLETGAVRRVPQGGQYYYHAIDRTRNLQEVFDFAARVQRERSEIQIVSPATPPHQSSSPQGQGSPTPSSSTSGSQSPSPVHPASDGTG